MDFPVPLGDADEGFFLHFSPRKKVRSAGQVSADLPRHVSSWIPAAHVQPRGSDEEQLAKEKEEEQRRKAKEVRKLEVTALLAVPMALRTQAQQRRIMELSDEVDAETHPKRRKRKKRRKRECMWLGASSKGTMEGCLPSGELAVGYRVSFFVRGLAAYGLTRVF